MKLKGANVKKVAAAAPAQAPVQAAAAPVLAKKEVKWSVECGHHASDGSRPVFNNGTRIEVVPPDNEWSDRVTIVYKNEETPPPASLELDGLGKVAGKAAGAKTSSYAVDAKFQGDTENTRFYHPDFWKIWRNATLYKVKNAPLPVEIRVHDPRKYKVELKFPEMKGYKSGDKYSKDFDGPLKLKPTHLEATETESKWSRSRFESESKETKRIQDDTSTGTRSRFEQPKRETKKAVPPISFTIGGNQVKLDGVEALGKFIEFVDSAKELVNSFKDKAPQVGWYLDFEWQFMQGAFVVEWYWKEHTDQTVFEYVDVFVQATIFSLQVEGGIGVSGFGFKLQAFFQVGASLDMKVSARRDRPVYKPGLVVPFKVEANGTLGLRFEVGNLAKLEGTGSTGIEVRGDFGVNRPDRSTKFCFDFNIEWTGIEASVTGSVGLYGLGGKKTLKKTLADSKRLAQGQWPQPASYKPPAVSRDRIRQIVLKRLTGWNEVKIATAVGKDWYQLNDYLALETAADELTDVIDPHPGFDRTPEALALLADGIRGDLEAIAADRGRKYVLREEFNVFKATVLKARLRKMMPPSADLIQAAKS